jgi:hypothetical protein
MQAGLPSTFSAAMSQMPRAFQDLLANPQALVSSKTQVLLKERFDALGPAGADLYRQFSETVKHSLAAGVTRLFAIGIVFAVLALVMSFLLKEIPLKKDEFFKSDASAEGPGTGGDLDEKEGQESGAAKGPIQEPAGAES